jgi:murein L,D-transpeptidase YafK
VIVAGATLAHADPFEPRTAAERLERRAAARSGGLRLPLPGTPDTERPLTRLASAGVGLGVPVMIRVFKAESELEVWVAKDGVYRPYATYPICYWSGALGPKLREGDRQSPEGFYTITEAELHHGGRWRRSLNIGYPNVFDRVNGRSGSVILVHGGCDSIGCFAMTNPVNAELYDLVSAALRNGQRHVPVHVFPFRMTAANVAAAPAGGWKDFWDDLKQGYDSFERTHLPPHITVCGRRYRVWDAMRGARDADGIDLCAQDRDLIPDHLQQEKQMNTASPAQVRAEAPAPKCEVSRASCRKWVALRDRAATSHVVARGNDRKRSKIQ